MAFLVASIYFLINETSPGFWFTVWIAGRICFILLKFLFWYIGTNLGIFKLELGAVIP